MGRWSSATEERRRSTVLIAGGVAALVILLVVGALGWRARGGGDDEVTASVPIAADRPASTPSTPSGSSGPSGPSLPPGTDTTIPTPETTAVPTTAAPAVPTTRAPSTPTSATGPAPTAPPTVPAPATLRVAIVGDSTAERLAPGIAAWGSASGQLVGVGNGARVGCPVGRGGQMHTAADAMGPVNASCDWASTSSVGFDGTVRPSYPDLVTGWRPDLVVVDAGGWDVADRMLPGESIWRTVGDPVLDAWLLDEMTAATDLLARDGARVVWLTQPPWEGATRHPPERLYAPAADPARMRRYNELLTELAQRRPASVRVVDLAGWIASTGEDARLRPDGAHFEVDTAVEVTRRFLGAQLVHAAA